MMPSKEVPDDIKKNVRAVLLSKVGGVLVSEFTKDYKSLLKEQLRFRDLGFPTIKEFIDAIPDVIRLEYDDNVMAHRMYGVGDHNTYMSLSQKRAERSASRTSPKASSCSRNSILQPNIKGLYTLCYPRNKEPRSIRKEDVEEKFTEFGNVAEVNMIPGLIFIRFSDVDSAQAALDRYSQEIDLRAAEEKNPKIPGKNNKKTNEDKDSDSFIASKSDGHSKGNSGKCYRCNESGHFSRECPNKQENGVRKETTQKKESDESNSYLEVFMGNIKHDTTQTEIESLVENFKPESIRLKTAKDDKRKLFAFIRFSADHMEQAEALISSFDQTQFKGRKLNARLSTNKPPPKGAFSNTEHLIEQQKGKGTTTNKFISEDEENSWDNEFENVPKARPWGQVQQEKSVTENTSCNTSLFGQAKQEKSLTENISNDTLTLEQISRESIQKSTSSNNFPDSLIKPSDFEEVNQFTTARPSGFYISKDNGNDRKSEISRTTMLDSQMLHGEMKQLTITTDFGGNPKETVSPALSIHSQRSNSSQKSVLRGTEQEPRKNYRACPVRQENRDEMPLLEPAVSMPPLIPSDSAGKIQLFISNFPYGDKDEELLELFAQYGASEIIMRNRNQVTSSTKALVTLKTMQEAERAVMECNQMIYKGRRLLVNLSKFCGGNTEVNFLVERNSMDNIKCTINHQASSVRNVSLADQLQDERAAAFQHKGAVTPGPDGDRNPLSSSNQASEGDGQLKRFSSQSSVGSQNSQDESKPKSWSSLIQSYKIIMFTLQLKPYNQRLIQGEKVLIYLTHMFSEHRFWGSVIRENEDIENLQRIMTQLQDPNCRIGPTRGLGRCCALFNNEWFRGWIIAEKPSRRDVDVFFVDYGNTSVVEKRSTYLTCPEIWDSKPALRPFQIADGSKMVHKDLENILVAAEIARYGIDETGYVTEVKIIGPAEDLSLLQS